MTAPGAARSRKGALRLALLLVASLAVALRSLDYAEVFPGDASVELGVSDSAYHARRALYSFHEFPAVLRFDPYLAPPRGARVPMPPLYDWALGGAGRLFGSTERSFERTAAWAAPLLAGLTTLVVFTLGRQLRSAGAGLLAAAIFALLPASVLRSVLGDVDHHTAVGLLGALLLAASLQACRSAGAGFTPLRIAAGGAARAALALSWSGSLLYLVLAESALLFAACLCARRDLLRQQAAVALLASAATALWLVCDGDLGAARFSATNLSWLHAAFLLLSGGVALALALAGRRWFDLAAPGRVAAALCVGVLGAGLALWLVPGLWREFSTAADFFAKSDGWGERNLEQQPLFEWMGVLQKPSIPRWRSHYGYFSLVLPLALAALWQPRAGRRLEATAVCAGVWGLVLGALAVLQVRYSSDFAPLASVAFAVMLCAASDRIAALRPRWPARALVAALGLLLAAPILVEFHAHRLRETLQDAGAAGLGPKRSLAAFGRQIRAATPETSGYLDESGRPEYTLLCPANFGHAMLYYARRAATANNFGPYVDRGAYRATQIFYGLEREREATALASKLGARYLITFARESADDRKFVDRLHRHDGVGPQRHASTRNWRLVSEGPVGGKPSLLSFPQGRYPISTIPYKLFERVPGALLEIEAAEGAVVGAKLLLESPQGRRFHYRARVQADATGIARLRVPYASDGATGSRALGLWQIRVGEQVREVAVSEQAVMGGAALRVPAAQ